MNTGESMRSLSFGFRINYSYISVIIKITLAALKTKLIPIFMPDTKTINFMSKAAEFSYKWNFPNCFAAIDGKHIRIRCPGKSGSLYRNYKDFFSIVLLAMVDANYKFVAVDIGSFGKAGDSEIFFKSNMGKQILNRSFGFPEECALPGSNKVVPHVIVGDEAFRLDKHIMKPYTKKSATADKTKAIFNYRLSRARRVTENAFGLLSQVFRIFYRPIHLKTSTCDDLKWVACCLHNMFREGYLEKNKNPHYEYEPEKTPPTNNIISFSRFGGFSNAEGFGVRETFKSFFNNEGAVSWLNDL